MREVLITYAGELEDEAAALRGDTLTSMAEDAANEAVARKLEQIARELRTVAGAATEDATLTERLRTNYTRSESMRGVIPDDPDSFKVYLTVGVQSFLVTRETAENEEHADWFRTMLAKALTAIVIAETARLLSGDFTAEEIHGFCHRLGERVTPEEFANGCAAYQRSIYGRAPSEDHVNELLREKERLIGAVGCLLEHVPPAGHHTNCRSDTPCQICLDVQSAHELLGDKPGEEDELDRHAQTCSKTAMLGCRKCMQWADREIARLRTK